MGDFYFYAVTSELSDIELKERPHKHAWSVGSSWYESWWFKLGYRFLHFGKANQLNSLENIMDKYKEK